MLHNRVAEARRSLLDTTNSVVSFDVNIAEAEPWQTEDIHSNQVFKDGTETDGTKHQQ